MRQNWAIIVLLGLLVVGLVSNLAPNVLQTLSSLNKPTPTMAPPQEPLPPDAIEPYEPPMGGEDPGVACTMEAKLCPDGSSVGRVPPNCDFAPCPGTSDSGMEAGEGEMCGGIRGIVCSFGYVCNMDGDYPDATGTCVVDEGRYEEKVIPL